MTQIVQRIDQFNEGRDPDLLKLKYQQMQANVFGFFRGTCHLFYEDWPVESDLNEAPSVWVCGDLHLENFGTYKGDSRLVYFDLNDFDEAALAPCTWDLARFLTSLLVGAKSLGVNASQSLALCHCFLGAYTANLIQGHARTLERETATGMIKDLLMSLKQRDRKTFLDTRTEPVNGRRKLKIDNEHTRKISKGERTRIIDFTTSWGAQQPNPSFFKVLDVAHRIAGTGSLGVERYVLLVKGKGSPDQNYLLDLKAEPTSCLQPYLTLPQPQWSNEAQRTVSVQQRVQGTPPALLAAITLKEESFVLRELQPTQDRLSLNQWNGKIRRLEKVMGSMGELVAWGQLRSGGRQGSAIADELIAFAEKSHWQEPLLTYAQDYSQRVEADYREFCAEVKKAA